uniref:Bindin n=1 Tax=Panagrolaimus sp. ES5 TaxID=591445 RepID=A0AC34GGU9_9BILA
MQGGGPMYSHTMMGQSSMLPGPAVQALQQQQQQQQSRVPTIAVQQPSLPPNSNAPQLYNTPGGSTRVNGLNGSQYSNGPGPSMPPTMAPPNSQRSLPSRPDVQGFDDYDEEDFERSYHY